MTDVNDNFGLACPNCGQCDAFYIQMTCMTNVTADGSEPYGDHDWDDTSYCCCENCGHDGTVADFHIDGRAESNEAGPVQVAEASEQ